MTFEENQDALPVMSKELETVKEQLADRDIYWTPGGWVTIPND